MNEQHVNGKWVGAYTYGDQYDVPIKGKTVTFEMELAVKNGTLSGTCIDAEGAVHFALPATIDGDLLPEVIRFTKRYPHYWQHEKNGPRFIPKLPSQEVCYSGRFVNDGFEGEWVIVTTVIDAQGEPVDYKGLGRWYMKKA